MGKVKVTQEQAEKLKMIDDILKSEFISIHKLKESLTYGYEVEPQFKVGDWIHCNVNKFIDIIKNEHQLEYVQSFSEEYRHATDEEIAEEKQRRWWKKHDREVWGLRKHDVLTHKHFGGNYVVFFTFNEIVDFYDKEESKTLEEIKKDFKVKYFAEDRKDIKENDIE